MGGEPTILVSDSFAVLIPGSRGVGRQSPPRPWGRGEKRLCRRRQKRRRCESRGLRAPFLSTETELGLESSRCFACPVPPVKRSLTLSRVYIRVQKLELSIGYSSFVPFLCERSLNDPGREKIFECFGEWISSSYSTWGGE